MGLFDKLKKEKTAPEGQPAEPAAETRRLPRRPQGAALSSGRMSALYRRLYRWIFSVNLTLDVYQIESGEDTFAGEPLPMRGHYSRLLESLAGQLLAEQREDFSAAFSPESIRAAVKGGRSNLTEIFCARELGTEDVPEAERPLKWYEFRVQWPADTELHNLVAELSVRPVCSDLDTGSQKPRDTALLRDADNGIDWRLTRAVHLERTEGDMVFEYDPAEDCMYLHRTPGDKRGDRVTRHYLATLSDRADFEVSHESVAAVKHLLRQRRGEPEQALILLRRDGVFGAPFRHYRMWAVPFADGGNPAWITGRLEDVEEKFLQDRQNSEVATELSRMMESFRIAVFQINTHQDLIFHIEENGTGFRRARMPQRFSEYIQKRVESGRIAPESREEYLRWLEKGYLQRKTALGPYIVETCLKDIGDVDFRWYRETIVAVKDRPGLFMRWRKDDTEGHRADEAERKKKELARVMEYTGQMLDTMASLVEFRSIESSHHIARVRLLTRILLEDMKARCPGYEITNKSIEMYVQASTLHDIGKITVPDYILNKEGRYTPEEYAIMKKHTTDGAAIIDRLNMPEQEELKACIRDVVLHHHERFDGGGYPEGLSGADLKIGVQVVSMADAYDALVSRRCYKEGYSFEEAAQLISEGRCGVFNPDLMASFRACESKLRRVYGDGEAISI